MRTRFWNVAACKGQQRSGQKQAGQVKAGVPHALSVDPDSISLIGDWVSWYMAGVLHHGVVLAIENHMASVLPVGASLPIKLDKLALRVEKRSTLTR